MQIRQMSTPSYGRNNPLPARPEASQSPKDSVNLQSTEGFAIGLTAGATLGGTVGAWIGEPVGIVAGMIKGSQAQWGGSQLSGIIIGGVGGAFVGPLACGVGGALLGGAIGGGLGAFAS